MRYSIIIDIWGMIWAVEWKRLFSALKIFIIGFFGVRSNILFFWEIFVANMCWYFSTRGTKVRCVENSVFLSSCIRGFFYSPRSYMINVLKINCGLPNCAMIVRANPGTFHILQTMHFKSVKMEDIWFRLWTLPSLIINFITYNVLLSCTVRKIWMGGCCLLELGPFHFPNFYVELYCYVNIQILCTVGSAFGPILTKMEIELCTRVGPGAAATREPLFYQ